MNRLRTELPLWQVDNKVKSGFFFLPAKDLGLSSQGGVSAKSHTHRCNFCSFGYILLTQNQLPTIISWQLQEVCYFKDNRPNVMQGATMTREKAETSDRSQLLLCSHLTLGWVGRERQKKRCTIMWCSIHGTSQRVCCREDDITKSLMLEQEDSPLHNGRLGCMNAEFIKLCSLNRTS